MAKAQEVSPFPEQEKSGEAMFNSSDSFFSREWRDVSQKEQMSKTALLGLSVRIAELRKEIGHGAGGRSLTLPLHEIF